MKIASITLLDLRLMFSRQPGVTLLLVVMVVFAILALTHTAPARQDNMEGFIDPARIDAAQHNFRKVLIPPAALAAAQQEVLDAAASHHLTIGRVDYAQEVDNNGHFVRASMRLPINGRYEDIRAFLEAILAGQPALSIRQLNIQREVSSDANFALTATLTAQFLIGEAAR